MRNKFKGIVFIISAVLLLLMVSIVVVKLFHYPVPGQIRAYFENYLTLQDSLPLEKADVLYILGGSARSTTHHIKRAAALFHDGKTDRILILDSREKWHYEPELGRNITRNELTIEIFVKRGVPKSCIDTLPVKEGFFGTLSEARALNTYVQAKGYRSVILVSSPCHSRRVSHCFTHYFKRSGVSMYIASSEDPFSFSELVFETVKVFVYKTVLKAEG